MLDNKLSLAAESDRLLRSGQYEQLLVLLRPLGYDELSPELRHRRAFAALRAGHHVEALRLIQADPNTTPILRRLEIEVLCAFRRHRHVVNAIRQTFIDFPAHGADFAYFALLELVFHRAFMEARFVIAHATPIFVTYAPGAVLDFKNREQFIDETEALFDKVLLDERYDLLMATRRLTDLDSPVVWWKRYLAGQAVDKTVEIVTCFSDQEFGLRPIGEATYLDGTSGAKLNIAPLPATKSTMGFCVKSAELTTIDNVPNLYISDGIIVPQLAAIGSTLNAGFCVRDKRTKTKQLQAAVMPPPLGDIGYFNAVLNGLFCLLVRQKYFGSLPIIIPAGYSAVLKSYADVLGIDEQSIIWEPLSHECHIETAITFLNEGRSLDARSVQIFQNLISEFLAPKLPQVSASERIYVSRRKAKQRKLDNEIELESMLSQAGFDIVTFEDLPPVKQIAVCRNARLVVAPHGAGLTNLLFASHLDTLIELVPSSYHVRGFENLVRQAGATYIGVVGKVNTGPNMQNMTWQIDLDLIGKILSRLNC